MPEQISNNLDEIMVEVYRAIYASLESRLHLIGSVIAYLIRGKIKREGIAALRYCDPGLREQARTALPDSMC